jgi:ribulose-5-phosphate 4-epimerase/fuculose-1-phosphate aldolase
MTEQEGVIKYFLEHRQGAVSVAFPFNEINAWRTVMFRLGLIGQDPERYDNLGFGNISQRLAENSGQFMVSGTQTGHFEQLAPEQYCLVVDAQPKENRLASLGLCKPSSEALTHASIYAQDATAQAVIHVHSPEIWKHTLALKLPYIAADVPYGTVAMATAVEQLLASGRLQQTPIFTMLGHEDGVVALGKTMQDAALALIGCLALALALAVGQRLDASA